MNCCVPTPCPRCGYCPTCGRAYNPWPYVQPYYPQPAGPFWVGTTGGYVPSTITGVMGTTTIQSVS